MATKVNDLAGMNREKATEMFPPKKCGKCDAPFGIGNKILYTLTIYGGVCEDCFYDLLGEEVERHSIASPDARCRAAQKK